MLSNKIIDYTSTVKNVLCYIVFQVIYAFGGVHIFSGVGQLSLMNFIPLLVKYQFI